jgi:segregation and condensation protein A|tara:strand:- start:3811 stop:4530 length:720 start_codon:yes stop_codon:yes gene_type:complete
MLLQEDEITWQTIIYDLIKSEEMDPWDIDISLLSKKYIETLKKLQEMNFAISGKVILASAILLKLKSHKLVEEDIARFEDIINPPEEEFLSELDAEDMGSLEENKIIVIPKMPQPRRRKVSLQDLVGALQKALQVDKRRLIRRQEALDIPEVTIPEKKVNINDLITQIYSKITTFFKTNKTLTFTKLVGSDRREDKIATFIPLLHLDHQRKIDLHQEDHFGEIHIKKRGDNIENHNLRK